MLKMANEKGDTEKTAEHMLFYMPSATCGATKPGNECESRSSIHSLLFDFSQELGPRPAGLSVFHLPAVGHRLQRARECRGWGSRRGLEPRLLQPHSQGGGAVVEGGPGQPLCRHGRGGEESPGLLFREDPRGPDPCRRLHNQPGEMQLCVSYSSLLISLPDAPEPTPPGTLTLYGLQRCEFLHHSIGVAVQPFQDRMPKE